MARPRKVPEGAVEIEVLRDGVFVGEDECKDKGERATCPADIAEILCERGHAKRV